MPAVIATSTIPNAPPARSGYTVPVPHTISASSTELEFEVYCLFGVNLQADSWGSLFLEKEGLFWKSGSVNTRGYPFPVY